MSSMRGRPPSYAVIARYRSRRGREHRVSIQRVAQGGWLVLDVHDGDSALVQALIGGDDGPKQARALARDYASEKQAYHDGVRLDDPLPMASGERAQAA